MLQSGGEPRHWDLLTGPDDPIAGTLYAQAVGFNVSPDADVGGKHRISFGGIPNGVACRVLVLVKANPGSGNGDSIWALVNDEVPVSGADTWFDGTQGTNWYRQYIRNPDNSERLVTSADSHVDLTSREEGARVAQVILIDVTEASPPSGIDGYTSAPVNPAINDTFNIAKNANPVLIDVLANDLETLALVSVDVTNTDGLVTIDPGSGAVTFKPTGNFEGQTTFLINYINTQGQQFQSLTTINVAEYTKPIAQIAAGSAVASNPIVIDFDDYISSPDGHALAITSSFSYAGIDVSNVGNVYTFTQAGANPPDAISAPYTIVDAIGSAAFATLNLDWYSTPPVAVDDTVVTFKNKAAIIAPLMNDTDPQSTALSLHSISMNPENGSAVINGNTITYTPNTDFTGIDEIKYFVENISSQKTEATINIAVMPTLGPGIRANGVTYATIKVKNA